MDKSRRPDDNGDRLAAIGDGQMRQGEVEAAIESFTWAAEAYERALRARTRGLHTARLHGSRGLVLLKRGDLLAQAGQDDVALGSYAAAQTEIEAALGDEPEAAYLYTNSAIALQGCGRIEAGRGQTDAALAHFAEAATRYGAAIAHDPGYLPAYNNRGLVYKYMADLLAEEGDDEAALRHLRQAEQEFRALLERDPSYASAHENLALILVTEGGVHMSRDRHAAAVESYQAAVEVGARALDRDPEHIDIDIDTLNYRATALGGLGDAYAALGEIGEAIAAYRAAALALDTIVRRAPDYTYALNNQGLALSRLASLHREVGRVDLALPLLRGALAALRRSLEIDPDDEDVVRLADETQAVLASAGAGPANPASVGGAALAVDAGRADSTGAGITVELLVAEPALWTLLDPDDLAHFCVNLCAHTAASRLPIERVKASIGALYARLLEDWSEGDRADIIRQVAASLTVGAASVEVLRLFLAAEPDPPTAATAVLDMVHLTPLIDADPLNGVVLVARLFEEMEDHRVAIVMGLLLLGDRRVLPVLHGLWERLDGKQKNDVLQARSGFGYASTVVFLLKRLRREQDEGLFGQLAAALYRLPQETEAGPRPGEILDVERRLPSSTLEDEPTVILLQSWTIAEYGRMIAPELRALAQQESEPRVLPYVMAVWGIAPDDDA